MSRPTPSPSPPSPPPGTAPTTTASPLPRPERPVLGRAEPTGPGFFFDRDGLRALALAHRASYAAARPYPHVAIDGLLGETVAKALADATPLPTEPGFLRRDYAEQAARLGQLQRTGFAGLDPRLRHLLAELSGMAFLDFLHGLTGIEGLIPDAHFRGAGLSLTLPGGHLALHADFNRDRMRHLRRVITVLYYLGEGWKETWGGALELWNDPPTRCEASYSPLLDRLVVMAHGDTYWHGHPIPLACPEGRVRAAIAAYYYVAAPSDEERDAHGAIWVSPARSAPEDGALAFGIALGDGAGGAVCPTGSGSLTSLSESFRAHRSRAGSGCACF